MKSALVHGQYGIKTKWYAHRTTQTADTQLGCL